jgi:F0F1-type ATP synthase assembly protein I
MYLNYRPIEIIVLLVFVVFMIIGLAAAAFVVMRAS